MNTHNFIFSNRPFSRISRHAMFWFCWFIFVLLAYHFPTFIFPDWNIQAKNEFAIKNFGKDYITLRGGWLLMIWEILYRQFFILLSYIAFTYAVLYYILPLYIANKKKWFTTTLILLVFFFAFVAINYILVYVTSQDTVNSQVKQGLPRPALIPSNRLMITRMTGAIIFYLTTLVSLAITIKLLKQWWLKQKETEQISKEKISAELQLLKAQIHPHFLFNSLNNIYSFALETSPKAPEMIQKLSGLLHYMLYDCKLPLVPLQKELKMIEDYISLEKIRYGERLDLEVTIMRISPAFDDMGTKFIAPLLLIPFVENSFKHGTSKMPVNPKVTLNIKITDNTLFFELTNSKPTPINRISLNNNSGLGLRNVRKRLSLIYPGRHELQITEDPSEYSVRLKIILVENETHKKKTLNKKEIAVYDELA